MCHTFGYSDIKDHKLDHDVYQVKFGTDGTQVAADKLETLINKVLDYIDEQEVMQEKEQIEKEEVKEEQPEFEESMILKHVALFESKGHLFIYDKEQDKNEIIAEDVLFSVIPLEKQFDYAFEITSSSEEIIMRTKVESQTQASISKDTGCIMWIHGSKEENDDIELDAYCFYFINPEENYIDELSKVISKVMFEATYKIEYSKQIKEKDTEWMADVYIEGDADQKEEEKSENNSDDDMYEGFEDQYMEPNQDGVEGYENTEIVQAYDYDRSFVARGDGYGVYSTNDKDQINYYGDFSIVKEYDGRPPENLTLHKGEAQLLFIDPNKRSKIQCYDFNKEKVVEEWGAKDVNSFESFYGEYKNAQTTPNQMIIACSEKGMFKLDPRVNKDNKEVEKKVYSTNYMFNRIASTIDGKIAVASKKGEIRMFNKMGQIAKTSLPSVDGKEITGIDLSKNGNWILATSKAYILLIPTLCRNGKNGFDHRMGAEKPIPRKLKLANSDLIKYNLSGHSFTKATFDTSADFDETLIVTSISDYVVIWKLKKVAKGNLASYEIKKVQSSVVSSQCRYNTDNELLVTMPNSITKESRRQK